MFDIGEAMKGFKSHEGLEKSETRPASSELVLEKKDVD